MMKQLFLFTGLAVLSILKCFSQEVPDGYTTFSYPNGNISSEGYIKDGKPDGYWITYYTTGIKKSEGLRTNFFLDSTWTFYNQSGEVIKRINYKYGKKNGYSYEYSYNRSIEGELVSKELFVNDKKEGKAEYYYDNGNLKEEVYYKNNKKDGPGREYDINGDLTYLLEYRNGYLTSKERINRTDQKGMKQGSWKTFYEDGRIQKEMYYKNNKLDGLYKEYDNRGNLTMIMKYDEGKLIEEDEEELTQQEIDIKREFDNSGNIVFQGSYKNNIPVGIHRFYNEKGEVIDSKIYNENGVKVSEGVVDEKGNKEGKWKDFYQTGELRAEGIYRNNQRNGQWIFYYKNGNREQEGMYLAGLPDGMWKWYFENGNLLREESYFNGREDGESIEYNINGEIITKGSYLNGEKEGEWIHKVGDNIEKGSYKTGLKTGTWYSYYNDGSLRFEGEYIDGEPNGKHKFYYQGGELKEERFYELGIKERNWKKFDEMGNILMTITYQNNTEFRINGQRIYLPESTVKLIK